MRQRPRGNSSRCVTDPPVLPATWQWWQTGMYARRNAAVFVVTFVTLMLLCVAAPGWQGAGGRRQGRRAAAQQRCLIGDSRQRRRRPGERTPQTAGR